jgi:hypothetical protein
VAQEIEIELAMRIVFLASALSNLCCRIRTTHAAGQQAGIHLDGQRLAHAFIENLQSAEAAALIEAVTQLTREH